MADQNNPMLDLAPEPSVPTIYFDAIQATAVYNGIFAITLERLVHGTDSGQMTTGAAVAAYLRCKLPAALELRRVLNSVIAGAQGQAQGSNERFN